MKKLIVVVLMFAAVSAFAYDEESLRGAWMFNTGSDTVWSVMSFEQDNVCRMLVNVDGEHFEFIGTYSVENDMVHCIFQDGTEMHERIMLVTDTILILEANNGKVFEHHRI